MAGQSGTKNESSTDLTPISINPCTEWKRSCARAARRRCVADDYKHGTRSAAVTNSSSLTTTALQRLGEARTASTDDSDVSEGALPQSKAAATPSEPATPIASTCAPSAAAAAKATASDIVYDNLPATLEIRQSTSPAGIERGRGLFATRHLKSGRLFTTRPVISVLHTTSLDERCNYCFMSDADKHYQNEVEMVKSLEASSNGTLPPAAAQLLLDNSHHAESMQKLRNCSSCKVAHYCGRQCQQLDWALHKLECDAIQRSRRGSPESHDSVPDDIVRGLARLVWIKSRPKGENTWLEFQSLQSNYSVLDDAQQQTVASVVSRLAMFVGPQLIQKTFANARELIETVSKWSTNAHALMSLSGDDIGVVISPLAALANHSCDPNSAVVYPQSRIAINDERFMQLRAIRDIRADEEITISYVDNIMPKWHRQRTLLRHYQFECDCELCTTASIPDRRDVVRCVNPECDGYADQPLSTFWAGQLDYSQEDAQTLRCQECGQAWQIDVPKVSDRLNRLESFVEDENKVLVAAKDDPASLCATLLELHGEIELLTRDDCRLGAVTHPSMKLTSMMAAYLDRNDDSHRDLLRTRLDATTNELRSIVPAGHSTLVYQSFLLFSTLALEPMRLLSGGSTTERGADDVIRKGFVAAKHALESCEAALGTDSSLYQRLVVELNRYCLLSALLRRRTSNGEEEENPFEQGKRLAAEYGVNVPEMR
ncbi:hypothetical protein ACM66B_004372 [Microbotryomycetes sp. NB124-2]